MLGGGSSKSDVTFKRESSKSVKNLKIEVTAFMDVRCPALVLNSKDPNNVRNSLIASAEKLQADTIRELRRLFGSLLFISRYSNF